MTKSALQIKGCLSAQTSESTGTGAVKAVAGAATQSVADQEAIQSIVP